MGSLSADHIVIDDLEITSIKNILNNYNHKIQFTVKEESYNGMCFLDVLVIRDGINQR